jgi:hypothetical protein
MYIDQKKKERKEVNLDQQVVVVEGARKGEQKFGARLVVRAEEVKQIHDIILKCELPDETAFVYTSSGNGGDVPEGGSDRRPWYRWIRSV